jgi:pyruvate formate lyase activating enzyme
VRENRNGCLYSLVYGKPISQSVDPIEKKPLFHVYPGSRSYSIATVGCNFRCTFCQNHDISQMPRETGKIAGRSVDPEDIVEDALRTGSKTIANTYTEPTIYFEYAHDIGMIARERGIKNIFVTNGFMTSEALDEIAPCLDAANCDLKSFSDEFYKKYCGGRLQPVLDSLKKMKELSIWVEVTTLIIPSLNDSEAELRDIARFICSIGAETPWHISRYYPRYKMQKPGPTQVKTIHRAAEIGKEEGLRYIYGGNIPGDASESTFCHRCGHLLIERYGYQIEKIDLVEGKCPRCKTILAGIFQ